MKDAAIRQVSIRRWKQVIAQSVRDLQASNALEWSATLAFYALLSLFPLLLAGMVVASYVADAEWATQQATELLGQFLPGGQGQIETTAAAAITDRRRAGIVSLVVLLFIGRRNSDRRAGSGAGWLGTCRRTGTRSRRSSRPFTG